MAMAEGDQRRAVARERDAPALRALPQGRHPQMKGSKVMAEDYAQVVDVLHDAALAIDASDDLIINALLNVAVEAAFGVYGPEKGRKLLVDILKRHLADAALVGGGEPTYYGPRQ
jgi:hypothetical protein